MADSRKPQFSLRSLLWVYLLACVYLAGLANGLAYRQRQVFQLTLDNDSLVEGYRREHMLRTRAERSNGIGNWTPEMIPR